jgi:hypothetical protein
LPRAQRRKACEDARWRRLQLASLRLPCMLARSSTPVRLSEQRTRCRDDARLTHTTRRAGASSLALSIAGAGQHEGRGSYVRLQNGHAWAPADLSRVTLRLSRRLDAVADAVDADAGRHAARGPGTGGLRLVSELNFAEQQQLDPGGCAETLGDAGSVAAGSSLTLWQGARCSFAFVSISQGDRVELLFGACLSHVSHDAACEHS